MERLKQTAQQNVVHAKALHEDLPRKIESVKKLVSEEKYEDADEEMRKWRRQTEMLQEQIDNQLKHCKDLRESKTLLSLYTEDAGILVGRRAREICSILKNDVLSLNFHFPKLAYNEDPSAKEEYEGKHSYDGEDGDEAKKMFEARRQSEGPSRDEIVHKEILELFQRFELSPGSVEKSESASDGADYEDTMSMKELSKQLEAIFELFFLRSRMITNVVFDTTQQKKRMDKEFGYIEDFRKIEQRNFNESDEVFQLNKLIKNSREMTTEIKSSRMSMAADAGETMHRLTTENKELLSKVEEALDRRDRAEQRLEEYLSENPLSTVDRIKMEEAISKMTEFRTKLQKQNDKNAEHAVETERLKDQLTVLNDKVIHLQEALRAQSEWFQPHVANLEHSLQMTKKSFNTVTMDIELISKLYQESLKNLENKRIYCEKIEEERNIMGEKLAEVIKKLRIEKRENVRKDALITKVMASRMASIDSVKEKEGKVSETYEKLHETESKMNEVYRQVAELEHDKNSLLAQVQAATTELLQAYATSEDYKTKWTRANAEKMALEVLYKDHEASLIESETESGSDRAELEKLRRSSTEHVKMIGQLEKLLDKANGKVADLQKEKKKFLSQRR